VRCGGTTGRALVEVAPFSFVVQILNPQLSIDSLLRASILKV